MIDKVSKDYLLRPMGIFQLIDYVGIDVFQLILKVMNSYIDKADLHSDLIDKYIKLGVKGGQKSSGAQKDGFLKYEKNRPIAIYDIEKKGYVAMDFEGWTKHADEKLGTLPDPKLSWRKLLKDKDKENKLKTYFASFKDKNTLGIKLAKRYFMASKKTSEMLVKTGVAAKGDHVNSVLTLGFFHLYGPINSYLD